MKTKGINKAEYWESVEFGNEKITSDWLESIGFGRIKQKGGGEALYFAGYMAIMVTKPVPRGNHVCVVYADSKGTLDVIFTREGLRIFYNEAITSYLETKSSPGHKQARQGL